MTDEDRAVRYRVEMIAMASLVLLIFVLMVYVFWSRYTVEERDKYLQSLITSCIEQIQAAKKQRTTVFEDLKKPLPTADDPPKHLE